MMKFIIVVICFFFIHQGKAQYFNFSQIYFGESRYNPALLTADNNAFITLIHRAQQTATDINLRTNFISISYPIAQNFNQKSIFSMGGYIIDDKTSPYGIYRNSEYAGMLAFKIPISKYQTLSFGIRAAYHSTRIDAGNYFTESQYIDEIGFDRSIGTGEMFNGFSTNYFSISPGLNFQQYNRGDEVLRLGLSLLELSSFGQDLENFTPYLSFLANGRIRLSKNRQGTLFMNSIGMVSQNRISINNGFEYFYNTTGFIDRLIFLAHYNSTGSFTAGFQVDQKRYRAGVSFDLGVGKGRTAYKNIVEIGIKVKGTFNKKKKLKRSRSRKKSIDSKLPDQRAKQTISPKKEEPGNEEEEKPTEKAVEVLEKDSSFATDITSGKPGSINHKLLIADLEEHFFMFEINSDDLSPASKNNLEKLSEILKTHPYFKVRLTGFTDSSGPSVYNHDLSLRRAGNIRGLLIEMGIKKERIIIEGMGEKHPVVPNDSEENRAKNRRVEMNFVY